MKKILPLLLLAFLAVAGKAQFTTITTYYILPPTSGCNGVWAINAPQAGCGSTYSFNPNFPMNCANWGPTVGDTLYLQLCSMPCDLTVMDQNAVMCGFCATGTMTALETPLYSALITTYPNPATTAEGWNLWLDKTGNVVEIKIYNSCGQLVQAEREENALQLYHIATNSLLPGNYIAEIKINGTVHHQKLVLTN